MNYHKIEKTSIANGNGVRVVLWVSGCSIHCYNCQNPQTWDCNSGKLFDETAKNKLYEALDHSYIKGITFSGGNPLEIENMKTILSLIKEIKEKFPQKDIWLYTGYTWEYIFPIICIDNLSIEKTYMQNIVSMCDVIVDGAYVEELRDITLPFRGSTNQRVIDVQKSLRENKVVLYLN